MRLPEAELRPGLTALGHGAEGRKTLGFAVLSLYHANRLFESESFMTAGQNDEPLSVFLPDFESMSVEEALAYIERTRRQLDRFDCLHGGVERPIDPAEAEAIRRLCDELEASLRAKA
jgi:hypothetical protein